MGAGFCCGFLIPLLNTPHPLSVLPLESVHLRTIISQKIAPFASNSKNNAPLKIMCRNSPFSAIIDQNDPGKHQSEPVQDPDSTPRDTVRKRPENRGNARFSIVKKSPVKKDRLGSNQPPQNSPFFHSTPPLPPPPLRFASGKRTLAYKNLSKNRSVCLKFKLKRSVKNPVPEFAIFCNN